MTQLEYAKKNIITGLMRKIAKTEKISPQGLLKNIKAGKVVIPNNKLHKIKRPCAIGKGLSTKVNANIGTSTDKTDIGLELKKLAVAQDSGADTIMDLSVGNNIAATRAAILKKSLIPVGTVPIYAVAVKAQKERGGLLNFSGRDVLEALSQQAKEGVDFFTVHSGVTRKSLASLKKHKRLMGIVSRGGAIIASWMLKHQKENPFYEYFDKILDIAYEYDVTLSLGDGMRPGSVLDATDPAQISELKILGELSRRARARCVQVMIEGPGHVPLDQIKKNILLQKKYCSQAPFYVLGPLVTDVAPGYDHITSAIGGALAASFGADYLCYVTPAEHLRHPSLEDVKEGVIASRIAAHAADIVKYKGRALEWDKKISQARLARNFEKQIALAIDPKKAKLYRKSSLPRESDACTMCGEYCSMKLMEGCLRE